MRRWELSDTSPLSFSQQLQGLEQPVQPNFHLFINRDLTEEDLALLADFFEKEPPPTFDKLSLKITPTLLLNDNFSRLAKALRQTPRVELVFPKEDFIPGLSTLLTQAATNFCYPVHIREYDKDKKDPIVINSSLHLEDFEALVISNIQRRQLTPSEPKILEANKEERSKNQRLNSPMALKAIILNKESKSLHHYIPIEIEHVQAVEIHQTHEIAIQQQKTLHVEKEFQETPLYTEKLVGYEEFLLSYRERIDASLGKDRANLLYSLLQEELFANLPHAIKYLSPAAAEQLSLHLSSYVTLNKENLPQGFLLKISQEGEYVLDYNAFLLSEHSNPFTPSPSMTKDNEPIYSIEFTKETVGAWIGDEALFRQICFKGDQYLSPRVLINMWIKYGEKGVVDFFKAIGELKNKNSDLMDFIYHHYLAHFPQWDHFANDPAFFNCLAKLNNYDETKLNCLKKFLLHTGSSQHDLSKTIDCFTVFWNELTHLCIQNGVNIEKINSNWQTPSGGNPAVYMERLLFILKNARDPVVQLNHLDNISLANYGPYYAAKYEGFKTVSSEMNLTYQSELFKDRPFNAHFKLYATDLADIVEQYKPWQEYLTTFETMEKYPAFCLINCDTLSPLHQQEEIINTIKAIKKGDLKESKDIKRFTDAEFHPPYQLFVFSPSKSSLELCYASKPHAVELSLLLRFIGLQTTGISLDAWWEEVGKVKAVFWNDKLCFEALLYSLFFVSHERFQHTSIEDLLFCMEKVMNGFYGEQLIYRVNDLMESQIKLNEVEGEFIARMISNLRSFEYVSVLGAEGKRDYINTLFHHLKTNKFATLKLLNYASSNSSLPLNYGFDTAAFLSQEPRIARYYRDDLLMFSYLLSKDIKNAYTASTEHRLKDKDKNLIIQRLEEIKLYLLKAIPSSDEEKNNFEYAIQSILSAESFFTAEDFLKACALIENLKEYDPKAVEVILTSHCFIKAKPNPLLNLFKKDNDSLIPLLIDLIIELQKIQNLTQYLHPEALNHLSISALREILEKNWEAAGSKVSCLHKKTLMNFFRSAKEIAINAAFQTSGSKILRLIGEKIQDLPYFHDCKDFKKLAAIDEEIYKLGKFFRKMVKASCIKRNENEVLGWFKELTFSSVNNEALFNVLQFLTSLKQRNFTNLAKIFFTHPILLTNKDHCFNLINFLSKLNRKLFPTTYLETFSNIFIHNLEKDFESIVLNLITFYSNNPEDKVIKRLLKPSSLSFEEFNRILTLYTTGSTSDVALEQLLSYFIDNHIHAPLALLEKEPLEKQKLILGIMSRAHLVSQLAGPDLSLYKTIVEKLITFSTDKLDNLTTCIATAPIGLEQLTYALKEKDFDNNFLNILLVFEKAPFGERDPFQFDCSNIDSIVNGLKDMINGTSYPYLYRKQLMEAFLFVNSIGNNIGVYDGKSAKELSNAEIKERLHALKNNPPSTLSSFQKRLLALGLLREAMYRSTGEFPNSTQMIAIIDAMMHQGDFVSNIDTGEGKTVMDFLKASLLWLDSDRVDVSTSSIADAQRDLVKYGPFLHFLDIPYAKKPITAATDFTEFKQEGINFSTLAQFSLFFSKAKVMAKVLESEETIVSAILNESDSSLLDDRTTYRFAALDSRGLSWKDEWFYYAVNEFIDQADFLTSQATAFEDIVSLKKYLCLRVKEHGKSIDWLNKFSEEQYLTWLHSALIAKYLIKENIDYVIPETLENRSVNGTELHSKVIKLLLHNGKISSDSSFGNGIQQFLYARLNHERENQAFIIEPLNTTIISSNNKNLVDYYRSKNGFIWASSATVGSEQEVQEQYGKFGFEFSKLDPHQKSQVIHHRPEIKKDEIEQFEHLLQALNQYTASGSTSPHLIFCKDIETATRLFNFLKEKQSNLQLYTGLGKEEDYIKNAALPGMITISTPALGRNTDIPYDREAGLHVWQTFFDSKRNKAQRAGRTGRQGSRGEVHYILNEEELKGRNEEEIAREIETLAAEERQFYELFHDIMGCLLSEIERLPENLFLSGKSLFFQKTWASLSASSEQLYHQSTEKQESTAAFITQLLSYFHQATGTEILTPLQLSVDIVINHIEQQHENKEKYHSLNQEVTPSDCTPPEIIAYQLLSYKKQTPSQLKKEEIREKLTHLFQDVSDTARRSAYLKFLIETPSNQQIIVEAHKEFLADFIKQHSSQSNVMQRWLGLEGKLHRITQDSNYLLFFHAFSQLPTEQDKGSIVELSLLKMAITALMNEYLDHGWFINNERRTRALELKYAIQQAATPKELINLLIEEQINTSLVDQKNTRPQHIFGRSRYQSALSHAITLLSMLSSALPSEEIDQLIHRLAPLIPGEKNNFYDVFKENFSFNAHHSPGYINVILSCLDSAFSIKKQESPIGMLGRTGFFYKEQPILDKEKTEKNSHTTSERS